MLISKGADEVDRNPRTKPPLAPKPKFISSEVTPSHNAKKTSPPSPSSLVTRRFPAPTEPPPPPPEKRSPESSPNHLHDLDGSCSSPFDVKQPDSLLSDPSVTEDHSASVHPAPSSLQLGSSDVPQKDERSGLGSSNPQVESKLQNITVFFNGKNLEVLSPSWQVEDRREVTLEGILEIKLKQVGNEVRMVSCTSERLYFGCFSILYLRHTYKKSNN